LRTQAPAAMEDPRSAASAYSRWESFWTGSTFRRGSQTEVDGDLPASKTSSMAPLRRSAPTASPASAPRAAAAVAAVALLPSAHGVWTFLAHASRFIEAGGVLVGAHFVNHGLQALLNRVAEKKGLDRNQISVIRLVSSTAVWTGAAALALIVGGAPHSTLTAAFGAGGTLLTLGLKDALGNVIQGVNFLVTRPFPIGARVDANVYDPETGLVASSTGEGTIHIFHEDSPDKLSAVETVTTEFGAKTMALDPKTHNLLVDTAEFDPPPPATAGKRPP